MKPSIIERAYQLGRSGAYANPQAIVRQLKAEQYEAVDSHFDSPSLRRTLRTICRDALTSDAPS